MNKIPDVKKDENKLHERESFRKAYDAIYSNKDVFYSDKLDDEEKEKAVSMIDNYEKIRVLDCGCGNGRLFKFIPETAEEIVGIDISPVAVEMCKKNHPHVRSITGVAEEIPYPEDYFDVVFCMGSLEHFMDIDKAMNEIKRVLKPGEFLIILVPMKNYFLKQAVYRYFYPNFHPFKFTKRLLNRLFKFGSIFVQPKDADFSEDEIHSLMEGYGFACEGKISIPEVGSSFELILKMKNS